MLPIYFRQSTILYIVASFLWYHMCFTYFQSVLKVFSQFIHAKIKHMSIFMYKTYNNVYKNKLNLLSSKNNKCREMFFKFYAKTIHMS